MSIDPVIISLLSLAMSAIALGWNIRSKFIAPKAKIAVTMSSIWAATEKAFAPFTMDKHLGVYLQVTNHGPGDVMIDRVIAHGFSVSSRGQRQFQMIGVLRNDLETIYERSREAELPAKLQMGDSVRFYFSSFEVWAAINQADSMHFGVEDTWGRVFFVKQREVRERSKAVKKTFDRTTFEKE
ncbi:MAG: hypothetical protein AAFQ18_00110 [Pseudomonadota bacterium]